MIRWITTLPNQTLSLFFGRDDRDNTLRSLLVQATSGSFALRIGWRALSFVASAVLARSLSLGSFGVYTYAVSWTTVLTIPSLVGLDQSVVREMAIYRTRGDWPSAKGLLRYANLLNTVLSVVVALMLALVSWAMLHGGASGKLHDVALKQGSTAALHAIWLAALLIPLESAITLQISTMRGLHKIVLGQLPNLLVRPILFVMLIGGTPLLLGDRLTAAGAMSVRALVATITVVLGFRQVSRHLPTELKSVTASYHDLRKWLNILPPLSWLGIVNMINARADFLLLGALLGAEQVALYGAAYAMAQFVMLVLNAANLSLAPTFAQIHANKDRARLQRVTVKSARAVLLASTPITLALVVFGKLALSIYGPAYTRAYTALVILVVGQFLNMAAGSVGVLLTMTGHERYTATGSTIGAVSNVALNLALIPRWGIEGAALANTANIMVWNTIMIFFVWRKLGIYATALGGIRRGGTRMRSDE